MIVLEEVESNFVASDNLSVELKRVNLTVERGEIVAVVGKLNSEKTAFLRCIACLDRPNTGSIQLDDVHFTIFDKSQIYQFKQNLSFIDNAKSLLKSKSVFENIALPLLLQGVHHEDIIKKVKNVANQLNIKNKLNLNYSQLSKLDITLICIARAIITAPKLLICDELTAGLDLRGSLLIAKLLKKLQLNNQMTIILSTNDLELIKLACNKVLVLDKASIVEESTCENFVTCPQSYVGKNFIKSKARLELPNSIRKSLEVECTGTSKENTQLIRCCFNEGKNAEKIIGELIDKFRLKINILIAHQETIRGSKINLMLLELTGLNDSLDATKQQLHQNEIFTEVLGYVK